jgi:hypothetical protein
MLLPPLILSIRHQIIHHSRVRKLLHRPRLRGEGWGEGQLAEAYASQMISPFQERQDRFQYAHSILEHLGIGEPDDAIALRVEVRCAAGI